MPKNALSTILHISDFHFTKRKHREQGIVVDALISDLRRLCIGHRKPDLVIFTGDLVQAAGVDLHDDAYDFLIDRVSKASGCSDERIFIVPGNHDLSWAGLERHSEETRTWRGMLGRPDELALLNEQYEAGAFDVAAQTKFANFRDLERYLRGEAALLRRKLETSFVTVDYIDALNIDVVIVNTAVLSTGGHDRFERDERQLAVPEYALLEAAGALTPGSLRIFCTHHPFSMLSGGSARLLEAEITQHANIHLFGHMHDPQPKKVVGLKGELLSNQAGAIFTARKTAYNGYALITIDRDTSFTETIIRSFFKERSEFDDGIDVIEGGRWWSSADARQHFRKIATPVDDAAFRAHLSGPALSALQRREKTVGAETHGRFVAPPLRRTFIKEASEDEGKIEIENAVSFSEIGNGDANLIIYGKPEYGRTTLLTELRYWLLEQASAVTFPRLPALIDFEDVSANPDNLLRKVRGGAEAAPDGMDIESLLKLGHACVLVDDVKFSDASRMRILRGFVERYPKARYIFSSPHSSATKLGAYVDPEMPVRFEFVEIQELKRNDMRQLLAKDSRCTNVELWLDRLQDEFREINLPFTAANGSILIDILSEKYNFTPINRSVLMEQFVDFTLRKAAIEQSRRETFDYTNKTDLLSYLAAWMAREDVYIPTKEALRDEMRAYVDSRGLKVDLEEILNEFLSARILVNRGEASVSFRYRGVLEYFIALRMTVDPNFKSWVMEDGRYLRFVNEILYYAGKVRNDAALITLVSERHDALLAAALSSSGPIDLAQLETMRLPREDRHGAVDLLAADIAAPPISMSEKDAELERQLPVDRDGRQDVRRPEIDETSERLTLSLLLYSGLIKNMELISDGEKRRHLSRVWDSWAMHLVEALRVAPRLAKDRRMRINGAMYEVKAPQGMTYRTLLRKLMLLLPHVHIKMIGSALGTEKLERQLTEARPDETAEPKVVSLLRTGLIADLGLAAAPGAIEELAEHLRSNHYLLWSLVVHISELRRLGRLKEEHFRQLEAPLAGAIAQLKGGSHEDREREKRRQLTRLSRDRLILTFKREHEERQ